MPNLELRYDVEIMSKPQPEKAGEYSRDFTAAQTVLLNPDDKAKIQELRRKAIAPLDPVRQASGTAIGFFDKGALLGFVVYIIPSLCLLGYGSVKATQFGYRHVLLALF